MTAFEVLRYCAEKQIGIRARGGLIYLHPFEAGNEGLSAAILEHKRDLLYLLDHRTPVTEDAPAYEVWMRAVDYPLWAFQKNLEAKR